MGRPTEADEAKAKKGEGTSKKTSRSGKSNRLEAMAHPLRARMLRVLFERGDMSPVQLSRVLNADLSKVSHHMHRLEELDCVEEVCSRQRRSTVEHFYRAIERPMIETEEFEDLDPIMAEDLVYEAMQKLLDDFVESRKAEMIGFDKNFHQTRTPAILDEEGLQEGLDLFERSRLEMSEIERRSAERLSESSGAGIPVSSDLLLFRVPSKRLDI